MPEPDSILPHKDRDIKLLKDACEILRQHFDTVQILCTRYESDLIGTFRVHWGSGNFYARYGNARLWCDSEQIDDSKKIDDAGND